MIDEKSLYVWVWSWILAQLVLPIETTTKRQEINTKNPGTQQGALSDNLNMRHQQSQV